MTAFARHQPQRKTLRQALRYSLNCVDDQEIAEVTQDQTWQGIPTLPAAWPTASCRYNLSDIRKAT